MVRIRTLEVAVSYLPQMSKLVVDRSLEFLTAKLYFFIFFTTTKTQTRRASG